MDLYIDTAETDAWKELMPTRLFKGITTNPLLASRAGLSYPEIDWAGLTGLAADLGAKEFHCQVYGPVEGFVDWAGARYEDGRKAGLQVVIKVPLIEPTIRAVPGMKSALGGPILMTACYDAKQMFVASALGAEYIAPYFGRMLEGGLPAYEAMAQMLAIGKLAGGKTRMLIASLRNPDQMVRLAEIGLDCFTIAPQIARDLLTDSNSVAAVADFEAAALS
ncbi:transaldolase family protein [Tropicimonas sp. TH_r6]|uniref:transaldolase family protein n=1 Tax=Tropicimonas sp. TH_r6 TaxID=3082085 RepID=UPI0029530A6A|nr:transaldolase family protein [Tropicimonas sp. TH_r6]MDV7145353.1 transaldolase family protein [Tropicimonas sp. TH_r6]